MNVNLVPQTLASLVQTEEEPRDVIASLLLAAKDDSALRGQLLFLLSTSSVHRQSLVNAALREMKKQRESDGVQAAFALLATNEGARSALDVLRAG